MITRRDIVFSTNLPVIGCNHCGVLFSLLGIVGNEIDEDMGYVEQGEDGCDLYCPYCGKYCCRGGQE